MNLKKIQILKLVWITCFTLVILSVLDSVQDVSQTHELGVFILVLLGILSFPLGPFLLYLVTALPTIDYQSSFGLEVFVISICCFIGGYFQWFIILPKIINKYWN